MKTTTFWISLLTSKYFLLSTFITSVLICAFMFGSLSLENKNPKYIPQIPQKTKRYSLIRGLAQTTPPEDPNEPWIETLSWTPRVFLYHHLLTDEECDEIIETAGSDVTRSLVVGGEGGDVESTVRTSSGVFLIDYYMKKSPLLRDIERRIAEWSKLPIENGEAFYLLRYEIGQEYKPHVDFFSGAADSYVGEEGDRCATVLLYLHTPEEGGETTFPRANLLVPAKKGNAVLFWDHSPNNHGDNNALHGGTPVIKGIKWAMTKWIRVNKFWHFSTHLTDEERRAIEKADRLYLESNSR